MNIRLKVACLLFFLLNAGCSIASTSTTERNAEPSIPALSSCLIGRWSPNCEKIGGINIHGKNRIIIEINSYQVYILSRGELHDNALDLFLDHPEDLGRGGMMLNWDDFSRSEAIAKMELVSEGSSLLEWLGFYSVTSKSRIWVDEPDFVGPRVQLFSKCND